MAAVDDADLKAKLSPEQYAVLREGATERPWSGKYVDEHADGSVSLRRVRSDAVRLHDEVRVRLRLAELHRARGRRGRRADRGPHARDGAHRGALPQLRVAPGPRLRRRPGRQGWPAVLHQLARAGPRNALALDRLKARPIAHATKGNLRDPDRGNAPLGAACPGGRECQAAQADTHVSPGML